MPSSKVVFPSITLLTVACDYILANEMEVEYWMVYSGGLLTLENIHLCLYSFTLPAAENRLVMAEAPADSYFFIMITVAIHWELQGKVSWPSPCWLCDAPQWLCVT